MSRGDTSNHIIADGMACRTIDTSCYLGSLFEETVIAVKIYMIHSRLAKDRRLWTFPKTLRKRHDIPTSIMTRLQKALMWPTATYASETWTVRKYEEKAY